MTMQKFHNTKDINQDHEENYINESCSICGVELYETIDIMVTMELDQYICIDCCKYHSIKAVKCMDIYIN